MKRDFKRVVSAALATVMVAQAGGVSALAAPLTTQSTTTTSATPTAAGMHQFTGTPDLIQSAVEQLKAEGKTTEAKKEDKALVKRVETASDKSYGTVKSELAQALIAQRENGTLDVSDLGLTQKDMAAVLQETLYDKYMSQAVTDVTYQTEGGKVTGINYNMSEGFAAAMDAMEDEQQVADVDTDAVTTEVAEQIPEGVDQPAAIALFDAEGGDAVDSGSTDDGTKDDNKSKCTNHTVGKKTVILEDVNGDGEVDIFDLSAARDVINHPENDHENINADVNDDGEVDIFDLAAIRDAVNNEDKRHETVTGSEIYFGWTEVADIDDKFDADGNKTNLQGLTYDPKTQDITSGNLPDYYYSLNEISFTCSECGEEVKITDKNILAHYQMNKDVYVYTKSEDMNNPDMVQIDHDATLTAEDIASQGKTGDVADWLLTTDVQIGFYMDDTYNQETGAGMSMETKDNGTLEMQRYYGMLSSFNADNAEYFGVSADYWTKKNTDANPMAAVKVLCNIDADTQLPPAQMMQILKLLPSAFMSYKLMYGKELLAMRDKAMEVVNNLPEGTTDVQKQLVLHDWLADNCTFDMGVMTNVTADGGNPQTDPIQMTTFGALLSDQLTEMPSYQDKDGNSATYNGAICLGYTAAYTYLLQNLYSTVYKNEDGSWKTPAEVGDNDRVDFIQAKFYADTANTSVAGEGFGGGVFNNVHYMNAVNLPNAPQDSDNTGTWFYTDVCYDDIYIECMAQYRGEAQGSIYHNYFLMSPQSIAALYEKGKSIDYIDSLYDGYVYEVAYNDDGSVAPSENIDWSKYPNEPFHPKYNKNKTDSEKENNNTCYENSWFSSAVSRIYNDGTNWYYVDGGSNMATQRKSVEMSKMFEKDDDGNSSITDSMDMKAIIHSRRVNEENGDKLKARPIGAKDYWTDSSSSGSSMGGMNFDDGSKNDPYAKVLFDYGTGKVYNMSGAELATMKDEVKQDFAYTEQYPSLTHSIGWYKGEANKIYFNLGNAIYTYDLSVTDTDPVAMFKEYNTVKYSKDATRTFPATSYYVNSNGKQKVTNKPIAALEIYEDYDFASAYTQNGFDATKLTSNTTMTVNIATNKSFTYPSTENNYTDDEAVNLNPDYQRQISEDGDNNNSEFLWCANIRDTVKMDDLVKELQNDAGYEATIAASCTSPAFTQLRTSTNDLIKGEKVFADDAKANGHHYVYNATEKVYICEDCGLHAYVVLGEMENGTAVMTSLADSGMGSLGSAAGTGDTVTPVDPEREAATKAKDGKITLTPTPADGYVVGEVYYKKTDATGDAVPVTEVDDKGNYTIVKPEESITVFVTFKKENEDAEPHAIDTTSITNNGGKASVTLADGKDEITSAKVGDKVKLKVEADEEHTLVAGSVKVTIDETTAQADENNGSTNDEQPKTVTLTPVPNEENTYTFEMPDAAVKVTATFEQKTYAISVTQSGGQGTVTVQVDGKDAVEVEDNNESATTAAKGDKFKVSVKPNDEYAQYNVTVAVTYEDPDEGTCTLKPNEDGHYLMPDAAVKVTVSYANSTPPEPTIAPRHNVTLTVTSGQGTVSSNVPEDGQVTLGAKVTVTFTPGTETDPDWDVKKVSYICNGNTTDVTAEVANNTYTFEMPNSDVKIEVEFAETNSSSDGKTLTEEKPETETPDNTEVE